MTINSESWTLLRPEEQPVKGQFRMDFDRLLPQPNEQGHTTQCHSLVLKMPKFIAHQQEIGQQVLERMNAVGWPSRELFSRINASVLAQFVGD